MAQTQLLRYARILMVIGGAWRLLIFNNSKIEKLYYAYAYILQISYSLVCFLMFIEFFYLLIGEDIEKLTDNIKITITCSLAAIKFIVFQNGKIQKLISQVIKEEQIMMNSEDDEVKRIYLGSANYINKCSKAIIILADGTAGFLVIATSVVGFMIRNNEGSLKPMIFLAHFPFDQDKYYGISMILQGSSIVIASVYYCMSQILYICILMFVKAQLKILQHNFRKFDKYAGHHQPKLEEIDVVRLLIKKHQFINSFVQELNDSIKYLLLIEFLLSSLNIASVTFQLIAGQTFTDLSFSFSYLIVLIGQVFILAWHANEIKIESIGISDAIYESAWYDKDIETRRILFMVIFRSQKPLTLTIGPFNPLTTQTVISVINGAYSYFTIMTSNY